MPKTIPAADLLAALHWRYATKQFDPARRIPDDLWRALEESLVLSPSSIGLQPWKFIVITDPALRTRLLPAVKGQTQVTDCSHFVVFAVRRNLGAEHVSRHIQRMVEVRGVAPESLTKFEAMVQQNLEQARAEGRLDVWQTHQVYIALGGLLTAAALLGVDTCPMEGFDPAAVDEVLALRDTDFRSVVACAAGYRAADDKYSALRKVRFAHEDVIDHR